MKRIDFNEIEGKTVKKQKAITEDFCVITFTDGTYVGISSESNLENSVFSVDVFPEDALELGFITLEEYREILENRQSKAKRLKQKQSQQTYKKLVTEVGDQTYPHKLWCSCWRSMPLGSPGCVCNTKGDN